MECARWENVAAERIAHQPPQARSKKCQNANDLAREAVGCMGVLDRTVLSKAFREYLSRSVDDYILPRSLLSTALIRRCQAICFCGVPLARLTVFRCAWICAAVAA